MTHNGTFTIKSPKGGHRTLEIKTERDENSPYYGQRQISIMKGSCNHEDFFKVGFVKDDLSPYIFRNVSEVDRQTVLLLWALWHKTPHKWAKGCELMAATSCRVCNRKLTNPVSIETGIGPTCAEKAA